jgi:hypothetical protein
MPLTTAETIILVYFKKGYRKEVKKDIFTLSHFAESLTLKTSNQRTKLN